MGLFGNKTTVACDICKGASQQAGVKTFPVNDGSVCGKCMEAAGYSVNGATKKEFISHSVSELTEKKQYREENAKEIQAKFEAERDAFNASVSDTSVACPRCGSTQISADKKGYGVVKGAIGAVVAGPVGLAAGNIGAKKVTVTCLKCGKQWEAGK